MQVKLNILHLARPTPGDQEFYTRWLNLGDITVGYPQNPNELVKFDTLIVDHRINVSDVFVSKLPNLKYICSANTALTHIAVSNPAIKVISLVGDRVFLENIRSVSEHAIYLVLLLVKSANPVQLLHGKQLGIVGYGRIGKQLARISEGLGMKTIWVDINSSKDEWRFLFETSDFVSVHLPENDTTRGLVSKDWIDAMKPTAYLINTARGSVIDEEALAQALKEHRITGAALDVHENTGVFKTKDGEWLENLLVTPHMAGASLEDRIATDERIIHLLLTEIAKESGISSHYLEVH